MRMEMFDILFKNGSSKRYRTYDKMVKLRRTDQTNEKFHPHMDY